MDFSIDDIERLGHLAPGAIAVYQIRDESISMLYFSDALPKLLGYTNDEYADRGTGDITDLVVPQDRDYVKQSIAAALQLREDVNCSYRAQFEGGIYHWMNVRGRAVGRFEGFPVFVAEFLDTTQETRMHNDLLDQAENGIYVCDAQTRELFYVNQKAHDLWGRSESFLGLTCHKYFRDLDAPCPWCAFNDMMGDSAHVESDDDPNLAGYLKIDCMKLTWFGRPSYCVSFTDVTGEKRAQEETRRAKEDLDELIDNMPTAILMYRKVGDDIELVQASGAVEEIAGLSTETILEEGNSHGIEEHVHPEDVDIVNRGLEQLFSEKHEAEFTYRDRSGPAAKYRWLHYRGRSFVEEDGSQRAYAALSDMTEVMERKNAEDAIFDMVAHLPVISVLYEFGANGSIKPKSFSDEFCQMLGITQEKAWEMYGEDAYAAVHPDDVGRVRDYVVEHLSDSTLQSITHRLRLAGGGWLWVNVNISWFTIGDDTYSYAVYTNIDDTKREEAELRRHYAEQQAYLESVADTFVAAVRLDVTADSVQIIGGDYPEVTDSSLATYSAWLERYILPYLPRAEDREAVKRVFSREALIEAAEQGEKTVSLEYLAQVRDASERRWMRSSMNLMHNPETDHVIAFVTVEDIDDEKIDQRVFDRMTSSDECDFVAIVDMRRRTVRFRQVSERAKLQLHTLGADFDEVMAKNAQANKDEQQREQAHRATSIETIAEHLAREDSYACAYTFEDAQGVRTRKLMRFSYIDRADNKVLAICTDITEAYLKEQVESERLQKALDDANAANQAKTDFLSRMSHDIRTPLNGVIGMTGLALDEEASPTVRTYLERIDESGKFLLSLVNDILDVSKAESGKLDLRLQPYSYREFSRYITSVIQPLCDEKGIEFTMDVPETIQVIMVDKLRFNQVFFNLLSNAVKFTPSGGHVSFTGRCRRSDDPAVLLWKFMVEDDGIGMSEDYQKKLFQPFEQEHSNRNEARMGSGLGLSIVKTIVDLTGGTIEVKSRKGEGTTFTVQMPIREADAETSAAVERAAARDEASKAAALSVEGVQSAIKGLCVLLAEDNQINIEVALMLLEKQDVVVQVAHSGIEAVSMFGKSSPGTFDAILMDVRMPMMDGLTATREIRALKRPDAQAVPIIAMTANAYEDDVRDCLNAGMDAHVSKPVVPQELFETLARQTGIKR